MAETVLQNDMLLTGYSEEEVPRGEVDFDNLEVLKQMHNKWAFRKVNLVAFSLLPSLQGLIAMALPKKNVTVGCVGEMTLVEFRDSLMLCERKRHTGYLKDPVNTPVDFFDTDISSYIRNKDGRICGLCLAHYHAPKNALVVELFFVVGEEGIRSLATMARFSLREAVKKYPVGTNLILPSDKTHVPLIKKLFGEK